MKKLNTITIILAVLFFTTVFTANAKTATHKDTLRFTGYGAPLGTSEDGTLNPLKTYELLYFNLQHQIFETLVAIDFNTGKIIPSLSHKWEAVGDKKIRFHLKKAVRFHNGEPFSAEAVKFSIELMKDPRSKFAGRFLLNNIASVDIIDDYTVDIVLKSTDVLSLRILASIGYMFPPKYYKRVGDDYFVSYPIGTGPFRFYYTAVGKDGFKEIHLTANEDYHDISSPSLKELVYVFVPGDSQWKALQEGIVDMVITQQSFSETAPSDDSSIIINSHKSLRTASCIFNIDKKGPLQKIQVREALQHAVNRKEIVERALKGYGRLMGTTLPEGSMCYSKKDAIYKYDIERAENLLKDAGYSKGFSLKVMAVESKHTRDIVKVLEKQLARIDISMETTFLDRAGILDEITSPKLKGSMEPSRFDMWVLTGWPDILGTGTYFYMMFFHSSGMYNMGINLGKNSPLDLLYEQAVESKDKGSFCEKATEMDAYLLEQSLLIPLYQTEIIYGMKKGVHYTPGFNDMPHRFKNCFVE